MNCDWRIADHFRSSATSKPLVLQLDAKDVRLIAASPKNANVTAICQRLRSGGLPDSPRRGSGASHTTQSLSRKTTGSRNAAEATTRWPGTSQRQNVVTPSS